MGSSRTGRRGDFWPGVKRGCGQNPARQTALHAGIPVTTPAVTVNQVCGSGLKAVLQAVQAIRSGDAHIVIAGGQESMSNAPYLWTARAGYAGHSNMLDSVIHDGCGTRSTTITWASRQKTCREIRD
jgi:acetyl-CoA acetyltransferase